MIQSFSEQLRRHSVALISLVVAVTSLGYNTWRNEETEDNRNIRAAGIELVKTLAELDLVVFNSYWVRCGAEGREPIEPALSPAPQEALTRLAAGWREGWARIIAIRDLGRILPEAVQAETERLAGSWRRHVGAMIEQCDAEAHQAIDAAIEASRQAALRILSELD